MSTVVPFRRQRSTEGRTRFDQPSAGTSTRTDVYARPDVYDMEYAGASNEDAAFSPAARPPASAPRGGVRLRNRPRNVHAVEALPKAQIVGLDASPEMLDQAWHVREAAEPSVRDRV